MNKLNSDLKKVTKVGILLLLAFIFSQFVLYLSFSNVFPTLNKTTSTIQSKEALQLKVHPTAAADFILISETEEMELEVITKLIFYKNILPILTFTFLVFYLRSLIKTSLRKTFYSNHSAIKRPLYIQYCILKIDAYSLIPFFT